ncbi:MAG: F-type H+-transporting ATPase subunit b [Candidatus Tokpelaia sp. JSC161]|jgi:F-type H+-transporting ATPase subunit b|nr:MAG: F-type H+-transporting ATPase subunit b [Candidatus Tokpelaia sp. JSC161]
MNDTAWAFIAFLLFLIFLIFFKVPLWIKEKLDSRSKLIFNELEEARRLREEAQQLLSETQRKRFEAEQEAESIISTAQREAQILSAEVYKDNGEYIERSKKMLEHKIAQIEAEAFRFLRFSLIDLAISAAERVLEDEMKESKSKNFFKVSLKEIESSLEKIR